MPWTDILIRPGIASVRGYAAGGHTLGEIQERLLQLMPDLQGLESWRAAREIEQAARAGRLISGEGGFINRSDYPVNPNLSSNYQYTYSVSWYNSAGEFTGKNLGTLSSAEDLSGDQIIEMVVDGMGSDSGESPSVPSPYPQQSDNKFRAEVTVLFAERMK